MAIFPAASCSLFSVDYCCGHWITCVVIEPLAWLLNCCVVTELIVFSELCTQNTKNNESWIKFVSLFPNHIIFFKKEKMTYERGRIVFPYLIINLLYFLTGICRTTWSNSSYQEYLQISLRCSSCRYHSLRTCVFTHIHFYKKNNVKCHSYRDNESGETK